MKYFSLIILPITIVVLLQFTHSTEFWNGKYDPEYCYLFNGLNLANQYGNIGHFDHPGTTVQVLSAIIIKITYKMRTTENDLPADVLLFPEYYLKVIAWTFTAGNCFLLVLLGLFIYKFTNKITYGLLFQSFSLLFTVLNNAFFRVSPEPVLLGTVIIFIVIFMRKYYFDKPLCPMHLKHIADKYAMNNIESTASLVIFGMIVGFCLATKINSLPLMVLPFLFIPKIKDKLLFLIFTFSAFIFFTLPIAGHYNFFYRWLVSIVSHSGYYGSGSSEVINVKSFTENVSTFIEHEPVIPFIVVLSFVFIIKQLLQKKYDFQLKLLVGLFLIQMLDILMVLKHFRLHYFIPIIPTLTVNVFLMFRIIGFPKTQKILMMLSCVLMCFWGYRNMSVSVSPVRQSIDQTDCINIYSYGCNAPMYALKFGNDYSKNMNSSTLERIYGNQYFYDIWSRQFSDWKQPIDINTFIKTNKRLILYAKDDYMKEYKTPFTVKFLSEDKYSIEIEQNKK